MLLVRRSHRLQAEQDGAVISPWGVLAGLSVGDRLGHQRVVEPQPLVGPPWAGAGADRPVGEGACGRREGGRRSVGAWGRRVGWGGERQHRLVAMQCRHI
eukprot:scaffold10121_cov112-Isochrysis_galbana.AAC.5